MRSVQWTVRILFPNDWTKQQLIAIFRTFLSFIFAKPKFYLNSSNKKWESCLPTRIIVRGCSLAAKGAEGQSRTDFLLEAHRLINFEFCQIRANNRLNMETCQRGHSRKIQNLIGLLFKKIREDAFFTESEKWYHIIVAEHENEPSNIAVFYGTAREPSVDDLGVRLCYLNVTTPDLMRQMRLSVVQYRLSPHVCN